MTDWNDPIPENAEWRHIDPQGNGFGFLAAMWPWFGDEGPSEHVAEVRVFEIVGIASDTGKPLCNTAGVPGKPSPTDDVTQMEVFLHGSIKWDHCSNWSFYPEDNCMLHFCDKEQAVTIGALLGELYDWAKDFIPAWD